MELKDRIELELYREIGRLYPNFVHQLTGKLMTVIEQYESRKSESYTPAPIAPTISDTVEGCSKR